MGRSARASGGVLLRSEHLQLRAALARATAAGRLVTVSPDVYVAARSAGREACIAAVIRRFPDAVLCGPTAAQLTFWPALKHDTVRVANVRARFGHPGYRWERRVVPPEWVEARTANHLVRIRGRTYYLDIAFVAQHVAVEIDGRLHERAGRAGSRRVCDPGRAQASRLKRSGRQVRRRAGCTTLPAI